ncbi:MAG: hypothetical protein LUF68_03075 [Clostridiales bacterium]|nr:hypothetical protein [Clostridiales bacterium]
MENVRIDPRLQTIIPPLTQDEFERLEANILEDGEVREPIVVWIDAILDGHNRWRIIQEHPYLPYKIKYMDFPDKWAAIVWMCHNQLGRRNISDVQKEMLMGEAYAAEKKTRGGDTGTEHGEGGRFTAFGHFGQMRYGSNLQSTMHTDSVC